MRTPYVLFFILSIVIIRSVGAPRCTNHPSPTNCKYGTVQDWCRNEVCAKGPREACGSGNWWENDRCTQGTYCACGFCSGCTVSLECWFC
uniref:Neuroparsin type 3 n=1 Tax=Hemigrapsus sanguineus TaxID=40176 RepID=A0A482KLV1_HEMSA|nr:neuroparsin type 3 [Hemigrapsus sanguineus]